MSTGGSYWFPRHECFQSVVLTEQMGKLLELKGSVWEIGCEQLGWRQGNEYRRHLGGWAPSFVPCTGRAVFCRSWNEHPVLKAEVVAGWGTLWGQVSVRAWIWAVRISCEAAFCWETESLFTLQDFCLGVLKASGAHLWLVELCFVTDSLPSLAVPQKLCWGTVPPEQAWTS